MAEDKGGEKTAAAQEKKKSPVLMIVIVIALLAVVGGGVAGYFLVLAPKDDQAPAVAPQAGVQAQGQNAGSLSGPIQEMDAFIVNLTDAQGTRYLKVTMQLEMSHQLLSQEIDSRLPQIRDEVITLLSSKSFEDVATIAGKRALKRNIMNSVNKYLTTGRVLNVYFSDFVVQ